jgi:HD-like signal output (HDOD) protein
MPAAWALKIDPIRDDNTLWSELARTSTKMSIPTLNQQSLSILVRRCPRLVGLQQAHTELLNLAQDSEASISKIEKGILKNPELTAKVLRTAGSAAFGGRQVRTVAQAVMILGLPTVRSLILSVLLDGTARQGQHAEGFDTNRYMKRALATALLCRAFSKRVAGLDPDEMYIMGLLQDIGYVVLDNICPPVLAKVVEALRSGDNPAIETETGVIGTDHATIGGMLASEWNFPAPVRDGISHHHAPFGAPSDTSPAVAVAHAACWAADALGLTIVEEMPKEPLNEFAVIDIGLTANDAESVAANLLEEVEFLTAA